MRLIDADALYEKTCDLEAQALDYAVKISNDEEKREEWLRWSAILAERTAFKHDVYDAPPSKSGRQDTGSYTRNKRRTSSVSSKSNAQSVAISV